MFKSMKKKTYLSLMFLLLSGLTLLFSGSSSAQRAISYQQINFAREKSLVSKISAGENHFDFWKLDNNLFGLEGSGLQKEVKVIIFNPTGIDVEIKDVDAKDSLKSEAYRFIGIIKAKSDGVIFSKSNRIVIARIAGKQIPPFSRIRMTDESEVAFQVQKVNNRSGYALVRGTKK